MTPPFTKGDRVHVTGFHGGVYPVLDCYYVRAEGGYELVVDGSGKPRNIIHALDGGLWATLDGDVVELENEPVVDEPGQGELF